MSYWFTLGCMEGLNLPGKGFQLTHLPAFCDGVCRILMQDWIIQDYSLPWLVTISNALSFVKKIVRDFGEAAILEVVRTPYQTVIQTCFSVLPWQAGHRDEYLTRIMYSDIFSLPICILKGTFVLHSHLSGLYTLHWCRISAPPFFPTAAPCLVEELPKLLRPFFPRIKTRRIFDIQKTQECGIRISHNNT